MFETRTTETYPVHEERATLTLLADGGFVLGVPRRTASAPRGEAIEAIKSYLNRENGGIVLPWPVDVNDERGKS